MKLPLYWIDAFTDRVFSGNPAGVVPLDSWLDATTMQRIAFENGLAETAFIVRTGAARNHIRWFTPTVEVDLCGHATLASAFVLFNHLGETGDVVTFHSQSGPLPVARREHGILELDFPSRPAQPIHPSSSLTAALGSSPLYVGQARDTLCVFARAADVLALKPDFAALARIDTFAVIATAPGGDCDFVCRFFAPLAGINEDPVTGSAYCTLVPYWAEKLGKTKLHARQISTRGGEIFCEQRDERVGIGGHCVQYLRGEIEI